MTKSSSKTYSLSKRSKDNLVGVHPDLVRVWERAIQITDQDFMLTCGVRTLAEQEELFGKGRTVAQCVKGDTGGRTMTRERAVEVAKPKLTVVTKTLKSNHFVGPSGFGHAVDVVPYPVDWNSIPKFEAIARAVKQAAAELKVRIEWGGDWTSFRDRPHFQLDRTTYR